MDPAAAVLTFACLQDHPTKEKIEVLKKASFFKPIAEVLNLFNKTGSFPTSPQALSLIYPPFQPMEVGGVSDLMVIIDRWRGVQFKSEVKTIIDEVSAGLADFSPEQVVEKLRKIQSPSLVRVPRSLKEKYEDTASRTRGILTFIPEIDDLILGVSKGTVAVIAGFTGSFKTTLAINMCYRNAYELGLRGAYWTTEVQKEWINMSMLTRHAASGVIPAPCDLPTYKHCVKAMLTKEQKEWLFGPVMEDLNSKTHLHFFDDEDMLENNEFSFDKVKARLEELDIDFFIMDLVNNVKYMGKDVDVNLVVRELTELSKSFRNSEGLSVIICAQINRDGWQKAVDEGGQYTLKCLAEYNELERSSSAVIALFSDEEMKDAGEIQFQLLKSRFSETLVTPHRIAIQPAYCVIGEAARVNTGGPSASSSTIMGANSANLLDAMFQ